jgi:hypothetical protein
MIPGDVQIHGNGCFSHYRPLSSILFESHSQLKNIGTSRFRDCSSLHGSVIPPDVEVVPRVGFWERKQLSKLSFTDNSLLQQIESSAVVHTALVTITVNAPATTISLKAIVTSLWFNFSVVTLSANS